MSASASFGRYRLVREIGRGAHATVHLAEDSKLGRRVALKIFAAGPGCEAEDAARRHRREVAALLRLDVPEVCRLFDAGTEGGSPYIAMTHVEGTTLDRLIAAAPGAATRRLELAAAIESAARTLDHVHRAGVVHGDLKPGNLIVGERGACTILDFSLAHGDAAEPEDRVDGGTLPYMAPEHFTGAPVGAPADVYALGATLHEALTGRAPFVEPTRAGLVAAILANDVDGLRDARPGVDRDLIAITERCLEKNLSRRYPTALALADDLARVRRGEPVRARRIGPVRRAAKLAWRHPAASFLAFFLVLALAAWLFGAEVSRREEVRLLDSASGQARRARERSAEAEEHLARFLRLSDVQKLADLERRSDRLWPPRPEIAADLETLLEDGRTLAARVDEHQATLADLRTRGRARGLSAATPGAARLLREIEDLDRRDHPAAKEMAAALKAKASSVTTFDYDDPALAFEDRVLTRLVADLAGLRGTDPASALIASAERRIEAGRRLAAANGDAAHGVAWERAIASIANRAECPQYAGLRLRPTTDLVPLGRDRVSGLWEFHHPGTGLRPHQDPSGRWLVEESTGLVLVLIPGGRTTLGARPAGPGAPLGTPFVDPEAEAEEAPVHQIDLAPYYLSKYEMTQGQWLRGALRDPAAAGPTRSSYGSIVTLAEPVHDLTWREASLAMWRVGLALPTEAQWEHATRAGTTTPWWTGSDPNTLAGCVNCADAAYFAAYAPADWPAGVARFDDGFVFTAPVGRFRANAFGLHDVLGNVPEWCRDAPGLFDGVFQEGDGEVLGATTAQRVFRGGGCMSRLERLRSSVRQSAEPDRKQTVGIRPARPIE